MRPYKPKRVIHIGRRPQPGDDWEFQGVPAAQALQQCDQLTAAIQALPDPVWKRNTQFLDDLSKRVAAIRQTIETSRTSTPRQIKALQSWTAAVARMKGPS